MKDVTIGERALVWTAIHRTLVHVNSSALTILAEKEAAIAHANMQLGTSAQVQANSDLHKAIDKVVNDMPAYYVREFADNLKRVNRDA